MDFEDITGSSCGELLPTGNAIDLIDGIEVTCIDNGMPVVLLRATDVGRTGYESPEQLNADVELKSVLESIRLQAGQSQSYRPENDADCRPPQRRCHKQPNVHPASLPRFHRSLRSRERGHRLPGSRFSC
ncbi:4-oxalomesaconate tautomerase [compost metagenome]